MRLVESGVIDLRYSERTQEYFEATGFLSSIHPCDRGKMPRILTISLCRRTTPTPENAARIHCLPCKADVIVIVIVIIACAPSLLDETFHPLRLSHLAPNRTLLLRLALSRNLCRIFRCTHFRDLWDFDLLRLCSQMLLEYRLGARL